jgi:RHH-type proline utilization regulon transcriptional repressor/proline dehydrogenase/delta 1-pyrroline-5-carboxylate dehydrogenase
MGPLIAEASGKLLDALTHLQPGESWLLEPQRLDPEGRMWSPGIKTGVAPGSEFHRVEYFGPVLGIMHARTLDEAIELQNAVDYGLTAGIHSLDAAEVTRWIDRVEAGNLYVNRGTTGAIVQRQPFGGWKRSVVGAGAKAGGPNYLLGLGTVRPMRATRAADADARPRLAPPLAGIVDVFGARGADARAFLTRATASDARAWTSEFGVVRDVTALTAERNAFRYRHVPVTVRAEDGADPVELARVVLAGLASGSTLTVSLGIELAADETEALHAAGVGIRVEDVDTWLRTAAVLRDARVRLLGARADELLTALGGRPDLAVYDGVVTASGRVELLPFLREQAVAITAHRFGTPSPLVEVLPLR